MLIGVATHYLFSYTIGWPAYVFLGLCVLMAIIYFLFKDKIERLRVNTHKAKELDAIEKKNRWIMGVLSVFALSGIIVCMHLTISCSRYAHQSATIIGTMALFYFIFIGIPYILMNMVKRKSSYWYGLMFPVVLAAIIQFFVCSLWVEYDDTIIRFITRGTEHVTGNVLIVAPLLFVPIFMFFDSLGKAFGFKFEDGMEMGYDKEKHKWSIVINKKQSAIVMTISFVWCILSLVYCYYYVASFSDGTVIGHIKVGGVINSYII